MHVVNGLFAGDLSQILYLLPYGFLGAVLCRFYEKRDTIFAPMMIHALNNKYDTHIQSVDEYESWDANNLYAVSVKSGEAVAVENNEGYLIQGALEQSGTNLADEMAEMITVQRAFQLAARVVTTAEENQRTISDLRR